MCESGRSCNQGPMPGVLLFDGACAHLVALLCTGWRFPDDCSGHCSAAVGLLQMPCCWCYRRVFWADDRPACPLHERRMVLYLELHRHAQKCRCRLALTCRNMRCWQLHNAGANRNTCVWLSQPEGPPVRCTLCHRPPMSWQLSQRWPTVAITATL